MLMERADMLVKAGEEENFEAAMRAKGIPILQGAPGVTSVKLGRGVENPDKFMLLVAWDDMAAHEAFKSSPAYGQLMGAIGGFARGGTMEHFELDA